MKENTLIEIGMISLVETVYGDDSKELEIQWVNESNYCMYPDEEREVSVGKDDAIKLIGALTKHFELRG